MFGTHTRAALKRRQAMDLGSGQDPVIGSPPPCSPPGVSQEMPLLPAEFISTVIIQEAVAGDRGVGGR